TCVDDARNLIDGTQGRSDAVMILPPYYYAGVRNDGLCRFFEKALSGNSLPVFLYHFPQHTGNRIDNPLIEMLLQRGIPITGIKDSGGDLQNALAYQARFPELQIFYASDAEALAAVQHGLAGSVTGGANPLPEFLLAIRKGCAEGNHKAEMLQRTFDVWNGYRAASPYFEIPLVKAAMGARLQNFPLHVRAPFTPVLGEAVGEIRRRVAGCLAGYRALVAH
ncbi:MAG: dihydrodipicolinate synthase family protein, partial [Gammaproteobacteria bacterium]